MNNTVTTTLYVPTETVAAQNAANITVIIPSSFVPIIKSDNIGDRCITVTMPVTVKEKAEQKIAHLAFAVA